MSPLVGNERANCMNKMDSINVNPADEILRSKRNCLDLPECTDNLRKQYKLERYLAKQKSKMHLKGRLKALNPEDLV